MISPRNRKLLVATALAVCLPASPGGPPRAAAAEAAAVSNAASDWTRSGLFGSFSLGSTKEPIRITADQLDFDYKSRVVMYSGTVEVTQGDMSLRSQTLTVRFDERAAERERLQQIVAEGEVRIGKGTRFATGGRAVFDQATRTVTLSENAVLHDGGNRVAGERVVVYLAEGRSVIEGGGDRVHAVLIQPDGATPSEITAERGNGQQRPD